MNLKWSELIVATISRVPQKNKKIKSIYVLDIYNGGLYIIIKFSILDFLRTAI